MLAHAKLSGRLVGLGRRRAGKAAAKLLRFAADFAGFVRACFAAFGRFVVGRHQLEERARGVPQQRVLERAALVGQLQQELAVGRLHGHDDAWQALLQLHVGSVVMVLR